MLPRLKAWASLFRTQVPFRAKLGTRFTRLRRAKVPPPLRGNPQALASLDSLCTPPRPRPSRCRCCSRSTRAPTGAGPRTASATGGLLQHLVCRLPLQPLHQPADCDLRRDRYQKVHVIFAHVPLQDEDVQSPANLADQIPDSMTNHPHQHRFAILRHPDQVQVDLEYAVRAMTVLVHGPILPQRNAEAFA